jgi:hypothetical protein
MASPPIVDMAINRKHTTIVILADGIAGEHTGSSLSNPPPGSAGDL